MRKLLLILILFPLSLWGSEPHGFVKTTTAFGVKGSNKNKFIDNNVRLQINIDHDLGENGNVTGSFDLLYEKYMDNAPTLTLIPIEMYAQYSGDYLGIKAGKYYDFWGLFEWISPTDILNPWDYTHISSDIEDYRVSIYGVNLSAGNDTINLEINFLPIFQHNVLPNMEFKENLPDRNIKNTQVATRLSGSVNSIGLDWDLYYFYGFDRKPSLKFSMPSFAGRVTSPTHSPLSSPEIYYQKLKMVGADFSWGKSSILFKLEGAYFLTEDKQALDPLLENPHMSIVAGFDWSPRTDLTISLAYKLKRYTTYKKSVDTKLDRNQNTYSASINYQPKDYLNFQWITLYRSDDKSLFTLPFISYSIIDDYTVTIGGVLFYGTEKSEFGIMKDYSNVFVEIKGSF